MARRSRVPTIITELSNVVVLIGGSPRLAEAARRAALSACGARVTTATVEMAATVATASRPFGLIVPKDIYEFGGSEFDALARDIRAELIVVPDSIQSPVLTALIIEAASHLM
ncbi:MAG: hypothetical protein U0414_28715 [Polyangiaceae bacterium]